MYRIDAASASQLPRERLQHLGAEQLSNQELLAILLRTGTKQLPVSALSQQSIACLIWNTFLCRNCNKLSA